MAVVKIWFVARGAPEAAPELIREASGGTTNPRSSAVQFVSARDARSYAGLWSFRGKAMATADARR
jgi:hypothetical protein